jgi:hypothetical protein
VGKNVGKAEGSGKKVDRKWDGDGGKTDGGNVLTFYI